MMDFLLELDSRIFLAINGFHSEAADPVMVWISGKTTWWLFYLLLIVFLARTRKWQVVPVVIFVALCVTLTDQVSVHLFKETIMRLRPCHAPDLQGMVHLVDGKCGGKFGFVSSHAANTFGVATLLSLVVRRWWFTSVLICWAALVGYSRIYLGVHYPGDVIGGALLGALTGFLVYLLLKWTLSRIPERWGMNPEPLRLR